MTDEDEDLAEHILAIGGTRPAMFPYIGVPWIDFVAWFIIACECLAIRWQLLILVAPMFLYSIRLYRRDYNAGRRFVCWMITSGRHFAANVFGGTFITPRAGRGFRGIVPDAS